MLDQGMLANVYYSPYADIRPRTTLLTSGMVGVLSMPFGPIGMVAGGMFGAVFGGLVGFVADKRRRRQKVEESQLEKKRLISLVRWAAERFNDDETEVLSMLEMVILEFKPMADIADGSKNARKLLMLLDSWVSSKSVSHYLWIYLDRLLRSWQELNRGDFVRSMLVFQTLIKMYKLSQRTLEEQETIFVQRMERLLDHGSVKSVMAHADQFPTQNGSRVMECMVYADHHRKVKKRNSADGTKSPAISEGESHGVDEDSDSDIEMGQNYLGALGAVAAAEEPSAASDQSAPRVKTLKKPFFKGWEDFMEFDFNLKHKMPITQSELALVVEKEKESTDGWDICVDRSEIQVCKQQNSTGFVTLRAWATIPGVNVYVALFLFHSLPERMKWDKVLCDWRLLEVNMQGSEIMMSVMKNPSLTPREFLQYRRCFIQDDGSVVIVLRSADHPLMPEGKGESKGNIRVESYISGYVLRQSYDTQGKPVLNLFLMSSSDVKGLIPKWVINYIAPKKPPEWVDALSSACLAYQREHPDYEVTLKEYAERFRVENPYDYDNWTEGDAVTASHADPEPAEEPRAASSPLAAGEGSPTGLLRL